MRSIVLISLALLLAGFATAQDTDFSYGPQYLVPPGTNPLLVQSIATPSMAVDGTFPQVQVGASNAMEGNSAGADLETLSMGPEPDVVDLFSIYYGYAPIFFVAGGEEEAALSGPLPRAGFRRGARWMTIGDLRLLGYGMTLGEAAKYWKDHPLHAKRSYTNEDIDRLKQK